jgi:hypothetical protein
MLVNQAAMYSMKAMAHDDVASTTAIVNFRKENTSTILDVIFSFKASPDKSGSIYTS